MPSCRNLAMCLWSITACRAPCRNRCPLHREQAAGASRTPPKSSGAEPMALKVYGTAALPRVNSGAARLVPIATMLVAVIATILPVRVPGYAALTPAFTLMAVYHWTIYRPDLLPPIGVFAIGLTQDLLSGAPVGIGALVLLLARAAVLRGRRYVINRTFPFVWTGFTLLGAAAMLTVWALHCLVQLTIFDLRSTMFRTVLTIAVFPVASFALGRTQRA